MLSMSRGWNNEYNEFMYTDEFASNYNDVNEQYISPQTSFSSCDEGFAATAEPYARMFSAQSGSSMTLDHLRHDHPPPSTSTASWSGQQAQSSPSSTSSPSYTQINLTGLTPPPPLAPALPAAPSEQPSPPQHPESDASGSENAATQHQWVQTGKITTTRLLSHLVIDESRGGVRYFFCGVEGCTHPSGFPHKSQLITHIRSVHLQEKPFLCITCNTPFARKQEAIRHVDTANSGTRFACNICGKTFARKNYRNSHRELCMQRLTAEATAATITTNPPPSGPLY